MPKSHARTVASARYWGIAPKAAQETLLGGLLRLVHSDADGAPGADGLLAARRRAERVRDALERLKPSERDALVLRYEADLSFREVAAACGIDEAAARKRVSRALEHLRADLPDDL